MALAKLHAVVTLCGLLALTLWSETSGSAVLELKMNIFDNSPEKLADGSCCDMFCWSRCDHIFRFSLDKADGSQTNAETGSLFSQRSGVFQDVDVNYFQVDMVGVRNPIVTRYHEWPGQILFKLYVEDDDSGYSGNDFVDSIIAQLDLYPQNIATATWNKVLLRGSRQWDKTSLNLEYKLYCDSGFYGPKCSTYCVAQDSVETGHYTCNPSTGDVVCRPGWKDPANMCRTEINECVNHQCQHGATCVNGIGTYTCTCAPGYMGDRCEGSTNLQCPAGVVGHSCDVKLCDFIRCQNGGSCANGLCQCRTGYTGTNCEESMMCTTDPCKNDGTCVQVQFRCDCLAGYEGTSCDVQVPPSPNATFDRLSGQPMYQSSTSYFGEQAGALLIALIVLVFLLLISLIILIVCLCRFKRRARNAEKESALMSRGATSSFVHSEKSVSSENDYLSTKFRTLSSVSSDADTVFSTQSSLSQLPVKESDYAAINPGYVVDDDKAECGKKSGGGAPKPPARPDKYKVTDNSGDTLKGDRRSRC